MAENWPQQLIALASDVRYDIYAAAQNDQPPFGAACRVGAAVTCAVDAVYPTKAAAKAAVAEQACAAVAGRRLEFSATVRRRSADVAVLRARDGTTIKFKGPTAQLLADDLSRVIVGITSV